MPRARYAFAFLVFLLLAVPWFLQSSLSGKAPSQQFSHEGSVQSAEDGLVPELKTLKDAAIQSSGDISKWKNFSSAVYQRLESEPDSSATLVFELIDSLQKILSIDPKEPDALLMMADIAFSQKVFTKASEFYLRYLVIRPEDKRAHAVYASSLGLQGKSEEAIAELQGILKDDPDNFQATAYLAIGYAEHGDIEKSREAATRAIELNKDPEAKQKMQDFVDSLDMPKAK